MLRTRSFVLAWIMVLLGSLPAGAGERVDPEWLAIRFLTATPAEVGRLLRAYDECSDEARSRVEELLIEAGQHPARFADRLLERLATAQGEPRERLIGALHALGEPALERCLARAAGPEEAKGGVTDGPGPLIQIECRLLEADAGVLQDVLAERRPTVDRPHVALDATLAEALLARMGKGLRVLQEARLTTVDGRATNVTATNQIAYVRDFVVKRDEEGGVVLDPIVATIQDGLVVDVEPVLAADRIALNVRVTVADLARPIPERELVREGESGRVQVPELHVSRVGANLDLPHGGHALVGGFTSTDENERVLLLKVERVEPTPR